MINPITEIDRTEFLCEQISSFYLSDSECYPDVILCVEDQKQPAHRFIMSARCEYFHKFFSTALNEPNQKEFIIEAPLKPFQIILQYFYTGKIKLCNCDIEDVEILIQVIDLVEKYCLFDLKSYFENYFIQILSVDNICHLLEVSRMYDLKELKIRSLKLIDRNAETILNSESFNKFSKESLEEILKRDSFNAFSQLCIFNALNEWSKSGNRNIETVLHLLKWNIMTTKDLLRIRNLKNFTDKQIFDAIEKNITEIHAEDPSIQRLFPNKNIQFIKNYEFPSVFFIEFDENFATAICNVCTLQGNRELLNGNSTLYDENNGYTRHLISDGNDNGIIIDLKSIRTINHIKMLLWDREDRSYSYFIEISADHRNWKRIIDYSSYRCRTWQNLYFKAEPIRLIKIVGTHCSQNEYFDIVTFETYLKTNIPEINDGFVVAKDNVALLSKGATILEGENNNLGLINGDIEDGWTRHDENGCILIRLNQPYHISSIRLLLDDCDENIRFKFKIQISLNMKDWETIVNQEEYVTSWQKFSFPSKPIIFIKFIGTHISNDNYYYSLNHFECPAQD